MKIRTERGRKCNFCVVGVLGNFELIPVSTDKDERGLTPRWWAVLDYLEGLMFFFTDLDRTARWRTVPNYREILKLLRGNFNGLTWWWDVAHDLKALKILVRN